MLFRAREFVMANLAAILAVALVLAVLFGAVQSVRINGFGVWPFKVEGLASKAAKSDQLASDLRVVRKMLADTDALRKQEQDRARASAQAMDTACQARINTARDAALAIGDILNAPSSHSPAAAGRALVPADQLRRVIGQGGSTSTGARGVSGGSHAGGAQ